MATVNFPSSPTNGETYTENGVVYTWDGVKWTSNNQIGVAPYLSTAGGTMQGNLGVSTLNSLAFPATDGAAGSALLTDGAGNLSFNVPTSITDHGTVSLTGSSQVWTGLPSDASMFYLVGKDIKTDTTGSWTSVRIGAGSLSTSGYKCLSTYYLANGTRSGSFGDEYAFSAWSDDITAPRSMIWTIATAGSTAWVLSGSFQAYISGSSSLTGYAFSSAVNDIGGTLDRIEIFQDFSGSFTAGTASLFSLK